MEKQSAEKTLGKTLRDGEQVLWSGKTEVFPLLAGDAKVQILSKWIGTVAAAIVILALYIANGGNGKGMIAVVLGVAVLLLVSPFVEQRSVLRQRYWITDQRVILISGDQTVYFMELDGIDGFRTVTGKTEYGSLVLGSCIFEDIRRQLRWRACHPKMDSQSGTTSGAAMGLVLFNLKDCRGAEELLRQYVEKTA
ncbi:MAG: hypothetical protein J6J81_06000 [Oscillospiraceae bacterium]|nr:hypothetical protein [Oscillospiraceae bacterium]